MKQKINMKNKQSSHNLVIRTLNLFIYQSILYSFMTVCKMDEIIFSFNYKKEYTVLKQGRES